MSGDTLRFVWQSMENMAKTFDQSNERLQDSMSVMLKLADQMEQGALVGTAGTQFCELLRGTLVPSMNRFAQKMAELGADIRNTASIEQGRESDVQGFMG